MRDTDRIRGLIVQGVINKRHDQRKAHWLRFQPVGDLLKHSHQINDHGPGKCINRAFVKAVQ